MAAPPLSLPQWAMGLEGLGALLLQYQQQQEQEEAAQVRERICGLLLSVVEGDDGDDDVVVAASVPRLWSALASLGWLAAEREKDEKNSSGMVALLARAATKGVPRWVLFVFLCLCLCLFVSIYLYMFIASYHHDRYTPHDLARLIDCCCRGDDSSTTPIPTPTAAVLLPLLSSIVISLTDGSAPGAAWRLAQLSARVCGHRVGRLACVHVYM